MENILSILSTYSLHNLSSGRVPRLRPSLKLPQGRRQCENNYIIGCICHKYNFCRDNNLTTHVFSRDKSMLATTKCLNKLCRDKIILYRETDVFCCLYSTETDVFCRDKIVSLFWHKVSRKIMFVATDICRDKHVFVATNTYLSRQISVATKIILVAALANDTNYHLVSVIYCPWYHYCFDPSKDEDNTAALGSLKKRFVRRAVWVLWVKWGP